MHLGKEHIAQQCVSVRAPAAFVRAALNSNDLSLLIQAIHSHLINDRKVHVYAVNIHVR